MIEEEYGKRNIERDRKDNGEYMGAEGNSGKEREEMEYENDNEDIEIEKDNVHIQAQAEVWI